MVMLEVGFKQANDLLWARMAADSMPLVTWAMSIGDAQVCAYMDDWIGSSIPMACALSQVRLRPY